MTHEMPEWEAVWVSGDFDEAMVPDGLYIAVSEDEAYILFERMVAHGMARKVGERCGEAGTLEGTYLVELGLEETIEPNPEARTIGIGREFFVTALRDYADWPLKWWRECIQNSVDAGAKDVYLGCEVAEDRGWYCYCRDDGRGMDEETLLDKFLVLGGTTKMAGDTAGGFGKAKELLLLPWLEWRVRTQDLEVVGSGIDYEVTRGLERVRGTDLRVLMPEDRRTSESAAMEYLQRCSVSGIRFYVNGERFDSRLKPGKLVDELTGKALFYHNKSANYNTMIVRTQGLYMFDRWLASGFDGALVVELVGSSVDLLTANRDGFRDRELRSFAEDLGNRIAADVRSALRKRSKTFKRVWRGSGRFKADVDVARADVLYDIGPLPPMESLGEEQEVYEVDRSSVERVLETLGAQSERAASRGELIGPASGDAARTMMTVLIQGQSHLEAMAKQLVWEPDFLVWNDIEGWTPPRMFTPEHMTPAVSALAKSWAELCRWVLIQLGSSAEFGVGFIFDQEIGAAHLYEDGEDWLLLNPFTDMRELKKIWSKANRQHQKWLYAAAVHEATHMADGLQYHDEAFASALTRNIARTADGFRTVGSILKDIRMRAPRGA